MNKINFFDGNQYQVNKLFHDAVDLGIEFVNGNLRDDKILNYKSAEEIKSWFTQSVPQSGVSYDELFEDLAWIGKYSISQSDIRYLSFPDSGNSIAAMIGDIFSKFLNQNMIAFDRSAPISTFVEIQLLEWLRELVGYEFKSVAEIKSLSEVGGMITTGGHMSNHIAMLAALTHKFPETKKRGLASLEITPKIAYSSKIGHYSHIVAAHHLGIGMENFVDINSTDEYKTDVESLGKILEEDRKGKNEIFYVICVAGNCRTCNIDDIKGVAEVCNEFGIWLHVDACHGGSLIFSEKLKKKYLESLEFADSISLDPHKGLFVTYPSSAVLFKKRDSLVAFSRYYEKETRDGSSWDLGYITPFFGSRGHESLKLWSAIKTIGKDGLSTILEDRFEVALKLHKYIKSLEYFVMLNDVDIYRMAFIYYPMEIRNKVNNFDLSTEVKLEIKKTIDMYTHKINKEIYEEGELCLDEFKLLDIGNDTDLNLSEEKFYVMSLTVGNPLLKEDMLPEIMKPLLDKCELYRLELFQKIEEIISKNLKVNEISNPTGPAGW